MLSGDANASYSAMFFSAVEDILDAECVFYEDFTFIAEEVCQVIYRTAESLDGTIVRQQAQIIGLERIIINRLFGKEIQCPTGQSFSTALFMSSFFGHLIELEKASDLREYVNGEFKYSITFPEFRRAEQCLYLNEEPDTRPFNFCIQASEGGFICVRNISGRPAEERPPLEERGI